MPGLEASGIVRIYWQEGLAHQSEADTFPRFEVSSSLGDQLDRVSVGTRAAMPRDYSKWAVY